MLVSGKALTDISGSSRSQSVGNPPCDIGGMEVEYLCYKRRKTQIKWGATRQRKMIKQDVKMKTITFEEGKSVDLKDLLFSEDRDYLIRNNSTQRVYADQLENKVIALYFVSLHPENDSWKPETAYLVYVYNELQRKGHPFEVVFVPAWVAVAGCDQDVPQKRYQEIFSFMPWTAVPFSDAKCYERLTKSYDSSIYENIYHPPASVVISKSGVVCQHNAIVLLSRYGAAGYPFSDDKIQFLISKDVEAKDHPSVTALLDNSPDRNYVINNKGAKIPITLLEDKVVALFFYQEGCTGSDYLITALEKAYELTSRTDFEVVLIYIHDSWNTRFVTDEKSFNKTFAKMPWLALPFKDTVCKKLQRVFDYPVDYEGTLVWGSQEPDLSLVIIGRRGEFCEPFGADILRNFGSLAYPFTRKSAVECRVEKAMKIKLDMLWCSETVFTRIDGSTVRFSELRERRIIVFSDDPVYKSHAMFLKKLEERYLQDKGTPEEFEVIHILNKKTKSSLPWLTHHPFDKDSKAEKCLCDVFYYKFGLIAFNPDGTVVRVTENPRLEMDIKFPFYFGGLEVEAWMDLELRFRWT